MSRLSRFAVATLTLAVVAAPEGAAAQDYSYAFRVSSREGKAWGGTVRVSGDRARIDAESKDGDREPGKQDYLLLSDGGRTVTVVDPEEQSYSVGRTEAFEQVVATAMHAVSAAMSTQLTDVRIIPERLGPGDTVAGFPTQRLRLTQEYSAAVGVLGFKTEPEYHVVITDYWVAPSMKLARNPLIELLAGAETALAQTDAKFVSRSVAARNELFTGMPLRMIVAGRSSGGDADKASNRLTVEVTRIVHGPVDRAALSVPPGYRETKDGLHWTLNQ